MTISTEGNMPRTELIKLIAGIRETYGLSAREYAKICGVSLGYFRVYAFTKKGTVTQETAGNFLAPFSFGFSPELMPPRKGPEHSSAGRWRTGRTPIGYVPFKPIQEDMLAFKAEEQSSWQRIADYLGWDRTQLNKLFVGVGVEDKKFMTEEMASFFTRQLRKARSLPASRREELFLSIRGESEFLPRVELLRLLADFRYDYNLVTWKAVADELDIHPDTLRGMVHSRNSGVRPQTMEKVQRKISEARREREVRDNHRIANLDRMYLRDAS